MARSLYIIPDGHRDYVGLYDYGEIKIYCACTAACGTVEELAPVIVSGVCWAHTLIKIGYSE